MGLHHRQLRDLLDKLPKDRRIYGVEIGVDKGENSANILKACPNMVLYMVDTWTGRMRFSVDREEDFAKAKEAVKFAEDRSRILRMSSQEAIQYFHQNFDYYFDFVFIDADHSDTEVRKDLEGWWTFTSGNALFSGHDYGTRSSPGVKRQVDAWAAAQGAKVRTGRGNVWWVWR